MPHARRFAVRHYCGEVTYDAADFLEANRDAVPDELLAAFDTRACEFGFATHLFGAELKVHLTHDILTCRVELTQMKHVTDETSQHF